MSKPKPKKAPPYLYEGPSPTKDDMVEETDDVYNTDQREAMLDDDEVTAAEAGFMEGQRTGTTQQKRNPQKCHQPHRRNCHRVS